VVSPRSRCMHCHAPIAWYHNIPVVSYVWLRGRCRVCKHTIGSRYVLVELLMSALAAGIFARFGLSLELVLWMLLGTGLLAIVFIDIDHWLIPDAIVLPMAVLALVWAVSPFGMGLGAALIGLIPAFGLWLIGFLFQRMSGREGLGFGDVKLVAVLGLLLGVRDVLTMLFLASVQGAVIGILVNLLGGHRGAPASTDDDWTPPPKAVPFGPFIVLAVFELVLLPHIFAELPAQLVHWIAKS
jgi:leader peptidase (prepilin peptidase) / N-methyltransferase